MPFYSIKVKNEQLIPLLGDGLPVLFCPNSSRSFCVNDLQLSSDSDTEVKNKNCRLKLILLGRSLI